MILFPNCKINLGLNVIRKREDGYHDLETFFYPLPLYDAVEAVRISSVSHKPSEEHNNSFIQYSSSGIKIKGNVEDNLCIKAYNLLKKNFLHISPVKMHLHKVIPVGAGLGGGSANGAFTIQLLNEIFQLNLSRQQLINFALQLGSDCPFFIINKPCFATGRGEILEELTLNLQTHHFAIINPGIHINTGQAFLNIKPVMPQKSICNIIEQPIATWKTDLKNDFETVVMQQYPAIENIKTQLYQSGALYAAMTGTGSTVYGIFEKPISNLPFPDTFTTIYL